MNVKNISIISSHKKKDIINKNYDEVAAPKYKNIDINYIVADDDKTISIAIKKVSIKSDLIIIIPHKLRSYSAIVKVIKNIDIPIVYCSIDNTDLHYKKNKIIKNLNYVIHGFKSNTYEIIINSALKILKYHGEKK